MTDALFPSDGTDRITTIIPLSSDPNLRRVRVGMQTVGTLRASDVESLGLRPDLPWTPSLARRVSDAAAMLSARRAAMNMLGRRAHGTCELIEKLVRKGHAEHIAKSLVEELAADHWIDDAAYAAALAEEIVRRKPASAAFVKQKLRARKLNAEDIDRAVAHSLQNNNQLSAALELARTRHAAMRNSDPAVARRRIGGTLARRGFDEDTINAVFDRLTLETRSTAD